MRIEPKGNSVPACGLDGDSPSYTYREIYQQPELWPTTVARISAAAAERAELAGLKHCRVVLAGAGSSDYASQAVAAAWPGARAVPTTDLLLDDGSALEGADAMISLARSGDSPESVAVVDRVHALRPGLRQLAMVCNPEGVLARQMGGRAILLDPKTNDQSLMMTSSFSNLVLGGLLLARGNQAIQAVEPAARRAQALLPEIDAAAKAVAARVGSRLVVLASAPFGGWRREAALKMLEMAAGRHTVLEESFLGLRHGPMSFLREDTVVMCLLSSDALKRAYELDLIAELRAKNIGYLVGIAGAAHAGLFDFTIPAVAPELDDALRTPFEITAPQLVGYHLNRMAGLDPDNPSPGGVIHRVVEGVRIHTPASARESVSEVR